MKQVVIVGGGITGLAAARTLDAALGRGDIERAVLLEAGPYLGGRIFTESGDGFLIEGGPDSFITLKPQAERFARALGLGDALVGTLEPRHVFVRHGGRLLPLPEGLTGLIPQRLGPFVRSPLFTIREKIRFGLEPFIPSSANGADESLGGFVRRRLGGAAVDRLAAPLLAGIHAGDIERLSLRATFPQLADAERRYGSLTRAVLARRRNGSLRSGPGARPLPMFMSLHGGLQDLVRAAAVSLQRVSVRTNAPVGAITRSGAGYTVRLASGEAVDAGAVILTVPAHVAAALLADLNGPAAILAGTIRSISTAVVALAYRREQVRHALRGHGYVGSHRERTVHTACTWVSSKWAGRAPSDMVLLRCFVGRDGAQGGLEMDDDDLAEAVARELRPVLGIDGVPLIQRIYRWPEAMPQYDVGHLDRLGAMEAALSATPGLILAGASYRGVGLPDCVAQGEHAAHHAVDALRVRQTGVLPA